MYDWWGNGHASQRPLVFGQFLNDRIEQEGGGQERSRKDVEKVVILQVNRVPDIKSDRHNKPYCQDK